MPNMEEPATAPNSPRSVGTEETTHTGVATILSGYTTEEVEPTDSDEDIDAAFDAVQCTACYRMYDRGQWLSWPVVSGSETVCASCI